MINCRRAINDHHRLRRRGADFDHAEPVEILNHHPAKFRRSRCEHHDRSRRDHHHLRLGHGRCGGDFHQGLQRHRTSLLGQRLFVGTLLVVVHLQHAGQSRQAVTHLFGARSDDAGRLYDQTALRIYQTGIYRDPGEAVNASQNHITCSGEFAELGAARFIFVQRVLR